MYIHIAQVQDFMRKLGIPRGFEQGTISRYFKDEDILEWLEKQKNG